MAASMRKRVSAQKLSTSPWNRFKCRFSPELCTNVMSHCSHLWLRTFSCTIRVCRFMLLFAANDCSQMSHWNNLLTLRLCASSWCCISSCGLANCPPHSWQRHELSNPCVSVTCRSRVAASGSSTLQKKQGNKATGSASADLVGSPNEFSAESGAASSSSPGIERCPPEGPARPGSAPVSLKVWKAVAGGAGCMKSTATGIPEEESLPPGGSVELGGSLIVPNPERAPLCAPV
mmetsp:Transcript_28679/g.72003  ORF Transcript_28679/g.72003 Transcript_28679/m.72003 type:complete len:233 (+) Transcript_28679:186-884(+)